MEAQSHRPGGAPFPVCGRPPSRVSPQSESRERTQRSRLVRKGAGRGLHPGPVAPRPPGLSLWGSRFPNADPAGLGLSRPS